MMFNTKTTLLVLAALTASANASGKAQDTCAQADWVPQDNTASPTKQVRCCAGEYDGGHYGSCDTSSCPNNFNHMKNRNCFNWGATNHNEDNFNPKGGSNNCPYAGSDHAICDTSFYTEQNPESCRSHSKGQRYQNHCLGKVKCNTVGITYMEGKGNPHSDGTAAHETPGNSVCAGATFGFKAGDDCFYNGSSENWKVCGPGEGDDTEEEEVTTEAPPATTKAAPVTTTEAVPVATTKAAPATTTEGPVTEANVVTTTVVAPTTDDPMTTTSKPGTQGDPHFKTHGGEMYDFHGGCDLVLLDNPDFKDGLGMLVHIRTKIETWWSYVESSVVRIGDSETIEISDRGILVNGELIEQEQDKPILTTFAGLQTRYIKIGDNFEAHIYLSGNEKLLMKTYKGFVKVQIAAEGSKHYKGSHGLLGNFPTGTRVGRDGVTLIEDVNAFGQEWQIREDEPKLFSSYDFDWVVPAGQKCAMPESSAAVSLLRKRRLADGMPMEQAQKACAHLQSADDRKACEFDVIATQDESMASVW